MSNVAPGAPVAGIDRWRGGWVIARGADSVDDITTASTVGDALDATTDCEVVAVDMPIALVVTGRRQAEADLRARLGPAGRSVFTSPTRAAIAAADQAEATVVNRAHGGPGISAQAWGLAGPIRELRGALPSAPGGECWYETHPETAFALMNGGEPLDAKRSGRGVGQRLLLLRQWLTVDRLLADAPPKVPVDDVLDAIAAWWSARRIADGRAEIFGDPGRDDEGFEGSIRV